MKGKKEHHTTGQGASSPSRPGKPGSPFSPLKPRKPCCEINHLKPVLQLMCSRGGFVLHCLMAGGSPLVSAGWCRFPKHAGNLGLTGTGLLEVSVITNCFFDNKVGDSYLREWVWIRVLLPSRTQHSIGFEIRFVPFCCVIFNSCQVRFGSLLLWIKICQLRWCRHLISFWKTHNMLYGLHIPTGEQLSPTCPLLFNMKDRVAGL